MSGSSIAAPDAAGWVTDFLNGAYFARPREHREVDDLRLALAILTTRWHRRRGGRLRAFDVVVFHRAFGQARFFDRHRSPLGTLDRSQLLDGARTLTGDWFPEAYGDGSRRGWGIAFPSADELVAYRPETRLYSAALGPITPPAAPPERLEWHTYPPVELPSLDAALAALAEPRRWPDFGAELGRFTPLRAGGLDGQTFEIEVVMRPLPRTPVYTRGYVTCTRLLARSDGAALREAMDDLVRRSSPSLGEPAVPADASPALLLELDTHEGHFMGRARSHLVAYESGGRAWLRDVGMWDPMPFTLGQGYRLAGRRAQLEFWGGGRAEASMLHQVALQGKTGILTSDRE